MYCTHIVYPFLICTVHICVITILHLKCSTQTHTLSGSCLAQVASLFVEAIKVGKMGSGKSLELFPTVLTALSASEALSYGKGKCKLLALVTLTSETPMSCWVVLSTRCRCYKMMNICLLWLLDIFFIMILGELTGEEYKKQLINSLCSSRWGHLISKCM